MTTPPNSSANHGVGPHPKPWPTDSHYDQELLAHGDRRNVIDKYRYWTNQAIIDDLNTSRTSLEIAIENLDHDFNIGTVVRNANAFNVRRVYIIGRRQWNKRGAMVTNRYLEVIHCPTTDDFLAKIEPDYQLIAIDNQPGAVNLSATKLPSKSILIFGSESQGISDELIQKSQAMVQIEQLGSTRSVNVGVASGIAMYQWLVQNHLNL